MKNIKSLAAALTMVMAASSALADSTPLTPRTKKSSAITTKPSITSQSSDSGYYVGVGVGTFKSAKKFKEVRDQDEDISYQSSKPKGKPAIFPEITFGYKFNKHFRTDLNAQYRQIQPKAGEEKFSDSGNPEILTNKFRQKKIKNYSILANAYFNMPLGETFIPYITAGIGYSYIKPGSMRVTNDIASAIHNFTSSGKPTHNLAWSVGTGSLIKLSETWSVDLKYRYIHLGKMKMKQTQRNQDIQAIIVPKVSQKVAMHEGVIGLIYNF